MTSSEHRSAEDLLPLSIQVFHILLSLRERDMHGYAIIGDIRHRTQGEVVLSTSTLYGAIQRMMRDGLVERSDVRPDPELDDERRRYYRITEFGRGVMDAEARRIERLAEMIRRQRILTMTS